jgi:hypothetical protein
MRVGGKRHALAVLSPGKIRYPSYRRLGGPQGWSGQVRKISPSPGFQPRTVQPVASRYTDYAMPAHTINTVQKQLRAGGNVRPVVMGTTLTGKCLDNKMFICK